MQTNTVAQIGTGSGMNVTATVASSMALQAAYEQIRRSLLTYLRRLSGDAQLAEDLMHDVMVKALAALRDRGETPRNLSAWLYRVAHNAAMDHHRGLRPEQPLDDDTAESIAAVAPDPDEATEQAARDTISMCLRPIAERLPPSYRDVVLAAEFDHRLLQDVADELGITQVTARQRASRGRRLLRDSLEQCCRQLVADAGLAAESRGSENLATSPAPISAAPVPAVPVSVAAVSAAPMSAAPAAAATRACGCAGQTSCH